MYRIINDLGDGRKEYYDLRHGINIFSQNESEAYIYLTLAMASKALFDIGKKFGEFSPNSKHDIRIEEI